MTCRHCGGKGGYVTKEVQRFLRMQSWTGETIDTEYVSSPYHGREPHCVDCGKPVRLTPTQKAARDTAPNSGATQAEKTE